jgi:hypothetical protein
MIRGLESGLKPLQAVYSVVWYNNRPCIYGDMALAIIQSNDEYAGMEDSIDTNNEAVTVASCTIHRKRNDTIISVKRSFSSSDAKTAGLDKLDHYKKYPNRMLQIRARSFAIRDCFSDALNGLSIAEEQIDVEILSSIKSSTPAQATEPTDMDEFTKAALDKKGVTEMPTVDDLKPKTETDTDLVNSIDILPDNSKTLEEAIEPEERVISSAKYKKHIRKIKSPELSETTDVIGDDDDKD